jgi:hypothetical protein
LLIFISFFSIVFISSIVRHSMLKGPYFKSIQPFILFLSEIPRNSKTVIKKIINPVYELEIKKDRFKQISKFKIYKKNKTDNLLILSKYDGDKMQSVVEIIDLNTFKILHKYLPNFDKINQVTVNKNLNRFKFLTKDNYQQRYFITHPFVEEDGSIIFQSDSPLVKLNICGKIEWINDDFIFHHSIEKDLKGNYVTPIQFDPSNINKKYIGDKENQFIDHGIGIINKEGKTIYAKSLFDIFLTNDLEYQLFGINEFFYKSPFHLNDIQPALTKSKYWEKDDLFLSLRHKSMILIYRPSKNKVIKILNGPFLNQHDVDIISDNEISIFNNNSKNVNNTNNNTYLIETNSEIIKYNFELNKYEKKFNNHLKEINFKTATQGLHKILDDGTIFLEETNSGRLVMLDKNGKLIWQYVNRSDNNKAYKIKWSRIISDKNKIANLKKSIKLKKCN